MLQLYELFLLVQGGTIVTQHLVCLHQPQTIAKTEFDEPIATHSTHSQHSILQTNESNFNHHNNFQMRKKY
jgi:hypothetical protein